MQVSRNELEALIKLKQMFFHAGTPIPIFLNWVADRLVMVHGDDDLVDFVQTLRERAKQLAEIARLIDEERLHGS